MPEASKARLVYPAIFLAAGLYVLILNFSLLSPIILSLLLILLITLALNPLVVRLRRVLVRRDIATGLMALVFLLVVGLAAWGFYSPSRKIIGELGRKLPEYVKRLEAPLRKLDGAATPPPGAPPANQAPAERMHLDINAVLSHLGKWAQALVSNTAALAAVLVTVFVGVVYTLMNPRPVFGIFFALVPEEHQETAMRIGKRVAVFVPRWALALLLQMGIVGTAVFLGVWPTLGLQNAILMGVLAFVFEAIPYIGAIIAGIPALLLAMQQGGSAPLWIVVAYVCIQLAEHNIINPLIVARSVDQHPVAVIASVLFCLPTFGILGVLLAVPLVGTLEILYDEIYRPRFLPNTTIAEVEERAREMLGTGAAAKRPTKPEGPKKESTKEESPAEQPRSKRLRRERGWTGPAS